MHMEGLISLLMESPLYYEVPVNERLHLVKYLTNKYPELLNDINLSLNSTQNKPPVKLN